MIFSIIGLSMNFIGTILLAFSVRKGDVTAMQEKCKKPIWESMIRYNPYIFYIGIGSLALGFFLQIFDKIPYLNS